MAGAKEAATEMSINNCLNMCQRREDCVAVDFEIQQKTCWFHTDEASLDNISPYPHTNLYVPNNCEEDGCAWTLHRNSNYPGSNWKETTGSTAHCLNFCRAAPSCTGVDFISSKGECWVHIDTADFSDMDLQVGTELYIMDGDCPAVADAEYSIKGCSYEVKPYTQGRGSTLNLNGITLDDCLEQCRIDKECVGADYVRTTEACWWHHTLTNLNDTSNSISIDLYIKDSDNCTEEVYKVTYSHGSCEWEVLKDTHAFDASGPASGVPLNTCLEYCTSLESDCTGVDFNGNECWFHSVGVDLMTREAALGNDLYLKGTGECDAYSTSTETHDDCLWTKHPFHRGIGATLSKTSVTLKECFEFCVQTEGCLGLDWISRKTECWFHFAQTNLDNMEHWVDSDLYAMANRQDCDLNGCSWIVRADFHLRDENSKTQNNLELDECLEFCRNHVDCVALDYVPEDARCWWHMTQHVLDNDQVQVGTNLYIKPARCVLGSCVWITKKNQHIAGSSSRAVTDVSLNECLEICTNDTCTAVDYIASTEQCWIHTIEDPTSQIEVQTGTRLYIKDTCGVLQTNPPPTTTTEVSASPASSVSQILLAVATLVTLLVTCT
ncbi:hypothetical protein CAPTEDRAFT_202064 [Capitella teleta]|uniref:Apple domain-containing protein n=1 Tax=Capitella teleta TaxID=283909 RepID=R7TB71_CAPTE|nr:hypothetical protein CAPTEDRAFT_202064 [Capitella teleta]|eukprot:ELT88717.1 hypothetical protein CAPTEDRAFT_202064 [Capitella teleta]